MLCIPPLFDKPGNELICDATLHLCSGESSRCADLGKKTKDVAFTVTTR